MRGEGNSRRLIPILQKSKAAAGAGPSGDGDAAGDGAPDIEEVAVDAARKPKRNGNYPKYLLHGVPGQYSCRKRLLLVKYLPGQSSATAAASQARGRPITMLVAACAAVPVQKRLLPLLARPASASACPPGATFVSRVSNESYVPGALCLVRAMRKLGGTCPFLLLLDDLPAPPGAHVALSAASTSSLAQAYGGRTQLLPLSALQARLVAHTHNASGAGHRRRLRTLHPTGWVQNTHRKLLLWALPGFSKVVFLDIDILIVANVDALLREAPFAAAAALPYATSLFNSGVMVLSPSLATAAALQSLSASTGAGAHGAKSASTSVAPRIRGALESRGTVT